MSAAVGPGTGGRTSAARMYRAMVGVGAVCALLIAVAYLGTLPTIERAKAERLTRSVLRALPGAATSRAFAYAADGHFVPVAEGAPLAADAVVVHAAYDASGALVGVAVAADGMGYQDTIRVLYGYAPQTDAIVGLVVLESKETPGLGDRIEHDPEFLASFRRLDVSLAADGAGLANPIVARKHGEKRHDWEIDGITGATVSSVAIAGLLNRSVATWAPRIRPAVADFAGQPAPAAAPEASAAGSVPAAPGGSAP